MEINPSNKSVFEQLGLTRNVDVKKNNSIGQSEFLKLMTAQLNNQDPLEPMTGGEFFSQIAQFSSVAGIQDLQKTFTRVADAMFSGQALQASSLVGRNVLVETPNIRLRENLLIEGSVEIPSSADDLTVSIYSTAGELIKNINLGSQSRGFVEFSWDGRMEDGKIAALGAYIVKAEARFGRESFSQLTLIKEKIESVTLADGLQGIKLNITNDESISLSQIKKIL